MNWMLCEGHVLLLCSSLAHGVVSVEVSLKRLSRRLRVPERVQCQYLRCLDSPALNFIISPSKTAPSSPVQVKMESDDADAVSPSKAEGKKVVRAVPQYGLFYSSSLFLIVPQRDWLWSEEDKEEAC
jgi:hypothetical protein